MRLFEVALEETRPSVTPEMEEEYRRLIESLKRENPRGLRRIGFARLDDDLAGARLPEPPIADPQMTPPMQVPPPATPPDRPAPMARES
jgi:hypothetical protein